MVIICLPLVYNQRPLFSFGTYPPFILCLLTRGFESHLNAVAWFSWALVFTKRISDLQMTSSWSRCTPPPPTTTLGHESKEQQSSRASSSLCINRVFVLKKLIASPETSLKRAFVQSWVCITSGAFQKTFAKPPPPPHLSLSPSRMSPFLPIFVPGEWCIFSTFHARRVLYF